MEEILFALGLKSIPSILNMILPIVVIIAVVMIVSRLGAIRNHLFFIRDDISKIRHREEKQDAFESFDRNVSMSDEEKAIEIAKNQLFEHLQKAPEYNEGKDWSSIVGLAFFAYVLFWVIIPESYLGFWSWIRWIVFLLVAGFIAFSVFSLLFSEDDWKEYERKLKRWEREEKRLQKRLDDLRK